MYAKKVLHSPIQQNLLVFCRNLSSIPSCSKDNLLNVFSDANRERCRQKLAGLEKKKTTEFKMRRGVEKDLLNSSDSDRASKYSVLIPLIVNQGVPSILFELRSNHMKGHRGEVCFPGGRIEGTETAEESALRETLEEVGLEPTLVQLWGSLPPFLTRNLKDTVTPIIGLISTDYSQLQLNPQESEVQKIFVRSLETLCDPENVTYTQFRFSKSKGYSLPVFLHPEHKIWGLTGMILHETLKLIASDHYTPKLKYTRPL